VSAAAAIAATGAIHVYRYNLSGSLSQ